MSWLCVYRERGHLRNEDTPECGVGFLFTWMSLDSWGRDHWVCRLTIMLSPPAKATLQFPILLILNAHLVPNYLVFEDIVNRNSLYVCVEYSYTYIMVQLRVLLTLQLLTNSSLIITLPFHYHHSTTSVILLYLPFSSHSVKRKTIVAGLMLNFGLYMSTKHQLHSFHIYSNSLKITKCFRCPKSDMKLSIFLVFLHLYLSFYSKQNKD